MRCPKCEVVDLTMSDRSGVEIDYCAACRGVWLDRGELDKIIERTALYQSPPDLSSESPRPATVRNRRDDDDDRDGYRRKRKKNFLGDLFDF